MPHVIVKLWPGKSEQQKERLADKDRQRRYGRPRTTGKNPYRSASRKSARRTGNKTSTNPDIKDKWGQIYKKPGYEM